MLSDVLISIWRANLLPELVLFPGILSSVDTWLGVKQTWYLIPLSFFGSLQASPRVLTLIKPARDL